MTPRQRQLLDFIHGYMAENGYQPSYVEMAAGIGYAGKSGIHYLLKRLQRDGHIERGRRHGRRSLRLLDGSAEDVAIATAGSAALAGELKRRGYTVVPPLPSAHPEPVEGERP